jgi:alpha-L-fucosidase
LIFTSLPLEEVLPCYSIFRPDRRGRVHEKDSASLMGFRALVDSTFKNNLALNKSVQVSSFRGKDKKYNAANLVDQNPETYWTTDDEITSGTIEIDLGKSQQLNFIELQEYIQLGQRVKGFTVEARVITMHGNKLLPALPLATNEF